MDHAAEHVAPTDASSLSRPRRGAEPRLRRIEFEASVRPSSVVVRGVGQEHPVKVSAPQHQHPVQALCPDRADPPLREGVRAGSQDRSLDDPDALRAEHLVEGTGVLGVPVPDHEADPFEPLPHRKVAGLLRDPCRVGGSW